MTGPVDGVSLQFLLTALGGYLIGSIPFGLVLTRLAGLGDIRDIGSGNIGATNVLRTGNKGLAALTLLLDGGKGFAVVYLVGRNWGFLGPLDAGLVAGFLTVVGHNFPVWLKFKGGKGVATTLGFLLGAYWPAGAVACAAWLLSALIFRYSSLAALVALSAAPLYAFWTGTYPVAIVAGALALFSFFRHSANIDRLLKGEEPKIGGAKAPKD
ncbi:MAG: glycerol-3-phosphate 1-O-acyltransferase PlsY [Rhodospirillales bacterium]|nr:glycerol-3-phosphate 1-O-acyltransferase PlsY [Rhodospirillales bacterium]